MNEQDEQMGLEDDSDVEFLRTMDIVRHPDGVASIVNREGNGLIDGLTRDQARESLAFDSQGTPSIGPFVVYDAEKEDHRVVNLDEALGYFPE